MIPFATPDVRRTSNGGYDDDVPCPRPVISPAQLQTELEATHDAAEFGRGFLLLLGYNETLIRDRLQRLIDGSTASTWEELHSYVERYFEWV